MKLKHRPKVLAAGAAVALYSTVLMWRGTFWYHNSYSMTLFSPAVIATGVLIFGLGLLPVSFVKRFTRRKQPR